MDDVDAIRHGGPGVDLVEDLKDELRRVTRNRDAWRGRATESRREVDELARQRDESQRQAAALEQELDLRREELRRLTEEGDDWREQAENWRREMQRLVELNENRLWRRFRRSWFPLARKTWWALPAPVRDFVRPIVFRQPLVLPPPARTAAPRREVRAASTANPRGEVRPNGDVADLGTLSVVMPTFNAGPGFERVLASIERQEGSRDAELVVVDSGSTDGTPELAAQAGARVLTIDSQDFQHGRTRNVALEAASGDTVVVMVQDALLLGRGALRGLAEELARNARMAAVSARQVPRSDSDLFGAFSVYSHHLTMAAARHGANGRGKETPLQRRAVAALDDVCAAFRRSAWDEIRFGEVEFAEDLDFGLRAVSLGWSIGVSDSVSVAHSHARDAVYTARRSAVDRLVVAPMIDDNEVSPTASSPPATVMRAARTLLAEVEGALDVKSNGHPAPLAEALDRLSSTLEVGAPRLKPRGELGLLDEVLSVNGTALDDELLSAMRVELVRLLRWAPLRRFAEAQRAVEHAELAPFAAKLTALSVGRAIGDSVRCHGQTPEAARMVEGV